MVDCPGGVKPVEPTLVLGIGVGLFVVLLLLVLSVIICCIRSCGPGTLCTLTLGNLVVLLVMLLLPKEGPCPGKAEPEVINTQGLTLDICLGLAGAAALAGVGLLAGEALTKPVHAVPRDERLAGHRRAS
eukprot:TRINITY_DN64880_c0_g1_i1.p2 TRINITY_DN64880_c0_g1~~TRINITY_DN64880_c0_g1_i1.p2  ORF type:complete len:130 (+),score=19.04 TRINITY_DN64880_c0_g1_i1:76-465(+)